MSHELRTPLNSILGFSQVLEREEDSLSDQQREYVGYIKRSGDHLLEMVNDILDLSKIEAGRIEIEKKPFNLNIMLSRSPSTIKSLADKKKIKMELYIVPNLGFIEADEIRIKLLLYNLLSNAIKFTDPGKRIGIEAHIKDDRAVIEVWDEGIGIAEEDLENVFNPFEQVGQAESGKPEGTGLGLAISRRLIELHVGSLSVKSEKGAGSRFTILLPGIITDGRRKVRPVEGKISERKEHPKISGNILVVEDNEINLKLITSVLDRLGYAVHTEKLGREGVNAALEMKFDLILMDINLPDINGVEAMKRIKEKAKGRIPIIALTAYAMKGDSEKFKAEGFDGYISKPIEIKNVRETNRRFLEMMKLFYKKSIIVTEITGSLFPAFGRMGWVAFLRGTNFAKCPGA